MITESDLIDARNYGNKLVDRLKGVGIEARLTETCALPMIAIGGDGQFTVHFVKSGSRGGSLRINWYTADLTRVSRPVTDNLEKTLFDVTNDALQTAEKKASILAKKARVDAAHEAVGALRAEYGLVEDAGPVRVVETSYNSGRFDVTFKTGTPEKVAEVLKALRAAGIV